MTDTQKPYDMITDFVTGRSIPNVGAEANRQAVEQLLVDAKGYDKDDIAVDATLCLDVAGETYRSRLDLVVSVAGSAVMAVKCAAGSLGSREREIVAAARLKDPAAQVPLSVVSDGQTAIVLDTVSGRRVGEGLDAIPDKDTARSTLAGLKPAPLAEDRRQREKIIFRSYDMDNVNVIRNGPAA